MKRIFEQSAFGHFAYRTPRFCKESFVFGIFLARFLKNQDLQFNENRFQIFATAFEFLQDFKSSSTYRMFFFDSVAVWEYARDLMDEICF
ncbi:hypothetical protein [Leptospira kirschneri]|uniref:hypothetical protein n=1 Tax=Leptospira kirschneri TaxID=29507 RepID=UPI000990C537|nr:hypothetical protein [Leptospira kirschneri]